MRLNKGEPAKHFTTKDVFDRYISLDNYKGKKLMLSFYRYASCPLCNLRINQLIQQYNSFHDNGLEMLAFFQSPKESILEYVGKHDAPFSIIADPNRKVYRTYGVESSWIGFFKGSVLKISRLKEAIEKGFKPGRMEGNKALIPADFLIDEDQNIVRAYYGKDIGDHLPIEEIKEWLKQSA